MMALEYNGTRVGAMQYNGVTIGEAMIDGEIVWSASAYPASGSWQDALIPTGGTYATHTVSESGTYTIDHTVTGGGQYVVAYIRGPWGVNAVQGNVGPPSTVSTTRVLAVGDVVEFRANSLAPSGIATGSWSIVKN